MSELAQYVADSMFLIDNHALSYSDPWIGHSLADRTEQLQKGAFRVAYYYHYPDYHTFRYRAYNMVQALNSSAETSSAYFFASDLAEVDRILSCCDVLVICRARYTLNVSELIEKAKGRNIKVFFDIDDLTFDTDYVALIAEAHNHDLLDEERLDFWYAIVGRIGATLKACDHVIVPNEFLGRQVKQFNEMPISVIPNFLNREQLDVSTDIMARKRSSGFANDGHVHVGYFSGSPTHNHDFAIVADALDTLMSSDERIVLRIVGLLDLPPAMSKYRKRIEHHPLQDFVNLQRLIGSTEITLAPLQESVFTNCKSELKFFEAAIAGSITLASPAFSYRGSMQQGVTGYLVDRSGWAAAIANVANNLADHTGMIESAYEIARTRYAYLAQQEVITRALMGSGA